MQLVERGIIGLHDPINKYLKEFQVVNPLGEREITLCLGYFIHFDLYSCFCL